MVRWLSFDIWMSSLALTWWFMFVMFDMSRLEPKPSSTTCHMFWVFLLFGFGPRMPAAPF